MMISVALAAYNGGLFIREQLESISLQNRIPDEVIVSDDCSTDDTVRIVKEFSLSSPYPIKLLENKTSLGITKNFERAIVQCSGDIIFMADQDDWWLPDKISSMMAIFEADPAAGMVHCNAEIVNENLTKTGHTLWEAFWFTPHEQEKVMRGRAFDVYLKHTVAAGMSMAFRSCYLKAILPIPDIYSIHDAWTALIISSLAEIRIIDACLLQYRIHGNNQVMGIHKMSLWEQFRIARRQTIDRTFPNLLAVYAALKARLEKIDASGSFSVTKTIKEHANKRLLHTQKRAQLPRIIPMRMICILKECINGNYFRYSYGFKSIAQDLFLR